MNNKALLAIQFQFGVSLLNQCEEEGSWDGASLDELKLMDEVGQWQIKLKTGETMSVKGEIARRAAKEAIAQNPGIEI